METFLWTLVGGIVFAAMIWFGAQSMDADRVETYIASRGGKLLEMRWCPFGPGWFGNENDRIYEIRYIDQDGNEHFAYCKTSGWSGVYFTEDQIVKSVARSGETPQS